MTERGCLLVCVCVCVSAVWAANLDWHRPPSRCGMLRDTGRTACWECIEEAFPWQGRKTQLVTQQSPSLACPLLSSVWLLTPPPTVFLSVHLITHRLPFSRRPNVLPHSGCLPLDHHDSSSFSPALTRPASSLFQPCYYFL